MRSILVGQIHPGSASASIDIDKGTAGKVHLIVMKGDHNILYWIAYSWWYQQ